MSRREGLYRYRITGRSRKIICCNELRMSVKSEQYTASLQRRRSRRREMRIGTRNCHTAGVSFVSSVEVLLRSSSCAASTRNKRAIRLLSVLIPRTRTRLVSTLTTGDSWRYEVASCSFLLTFAPTFFVLPEELPATKVVQRERWLRLFAGNAGVVKRWVGQHEG